MLAHSNILLVAYISLVSNNLQRSYWPDKKLANKIDATLKCASDLDISPKVEAAFKKCQNIYDFSSLHAWDSTKSSSFLEWLNGRGGCHTFKEIMEWISSEYSTDVCILQNLNWLDHNLSINKDALDNDIASMHKKYPLVSVKW